MGKVLRQFSVFLMNLYLQKPHATIGTDQTKKTLAIHYGWDRGS